MDDLGDIKYKLFRFTDISVSKITDALFHFADQIICDYKVSNKFKAHMYEGPVVMSGGGGGFEGKIKIF